MRRLDKESDERSITGVLPEVTDYCRLVLLRHPELEPSFSNLAVGDGAAKVGRRGQEQVLRWFTLFESLPFDAVHCADQPQSADSAGALAANQQLALAVDPRLNDQNMGTWQGRAWDEIVLEEGEAVQEFFTNFGDASAPEGESLGTAVERMYGWWTEVLPATRGQTLMVVASGAMISGFATALLGMRLSRSVSLNLPYGGVGVLDCFGNGARVATWNPTAL